MGEAYDEIISLGNSCRVAYNIRRTFGIERAFPFDWWVTPIEALIAFLEDPDLDKLYDPARMVPVMRGEKIFAIDNIHYGIQLQHEFPRLKGGSLAPDWPEHLGKARERTAFLWNRMLDLPAGTRILFVRWFANAERKALKRNARAKIFAAHAALSRLFPRTPFDLLLVDSPDWVREPGISMLDVYDRAKGWRGSPELWTERLRGHGVRWTGTPGLAALAGPEEDHEGFV